MKGDTVILQSSKPPYTLDFRGTSSSDSITIYVTDSVEPYLLTPIALNTHQYSTDLSGAVRVPRQLVDTLYVSSFPCYSGPIVIDKEKIKSTDTIVVAMDGNVIGKHYFKHEKWLLKNKKLYHTQDSDGNFDPNKYFDKAKLTDLKYHKGH